MKLLLVDGYYYAYRSFHALIGLTTPMGEPVGAVFGFLKALRRMQKDLHPDRAAVVWDEGIPARRSSLQPEYKAQRAEMPEALESQLPLLRKLITLIGFPSVSLPDTEADDLMASYAYAARALGWECILATADKDLFQIVAPDIRIYTTQKPELASPKDTHALLSAERVRQKWGVSPDQLGDLLSLVGDNADNIPGISGIGPKTAAVLLRTYGSLEAIYADLASVTPVKLREKLTAGRTQLEQNREMVRLDLNLPLPVPVNSLQIRPQFEPLFKSLQDAGLRSLESDMRREEADSQKPRQAELFG